MKSLVVEDESKIGEYLQQGLSEADSVAGLACNDLDGRHPATTGDCDLLILDVMLPDLEGWQILHALCSTELAMPVLFLTVHDSVADRVKGLELGVDDCMVEPFAFAGLLARVRTLFQRSNAPSLVERIQVADLMLDLTHRRAFRGDQRITLTSKESSLLELLVRCHGEVLPRPPVAFQAWDMNSDSDTNVIDVVIRRLHAKIDDNSEPKLVHAVRGMGCILEDPEDGE